MEKIWLEVFADASQWCDRRPGKVNPRYPDFKCRSRRKPLWCIHKLESPWVDTETVRTGELSSFSWNKKLAKSAKAGDYKKVMNLFRQMQQQSQKLNTFSFVRVLNACASLQALEEGRRVHAQAISYGFESDVYVGSCLVDMYAKCGSIEDARRVFNKMPIRNVVSWSAMIRGYVRCGEGQKALDLYRKMHLDGVAPNSITFVGLLNACASLVALDEGRRVHEQIIHNGYESDVFVGSCLVDMYSKCGSIEDAQRVFNKMPIRDVVSWSAMILAHVKHGEGKKALELSRQMRRAGVVPDPVTFVALLNACASVAALEEGRRVHKQIIRRGYESDMFVGSSLVDMYAKCGSIDDAWRVFNKMPRRDVVAWGAMLLGYVKCGGGEKALQLSRQMQKEGVEPNHITFVGVLNACASVGALEEGRHVHKQIIGSGCEPDIYVSSCLVDMYGKCGSIEDAEKIFNKIRKHDVVSWTTMLGGYAMHGYGKEALRLFERMCQERVEINMVTYVSILSACSHAGLVDEGLHYFESMSAVHSISAIVEHYACIIDLLARAGRLSEAEYLINMLVCEPNASVWMPVLGACKVHGYVEMAERVAKQILEIDPQNAASYILLSDIYAARGEWDSSENIKQEGLLKCLKKQPECTWIEVNGELHSFLLDECKHTEIVEICTELERLSEQMKKAGYSQAANFKFQ